METTVSHTGEAEHSGIGNNVDEYRQAVRKTIEAEVKRALDEEMIKATQELADEQTKAIRQIVEEYRLAIRDIVEEERKSIWTRMEELRKSILKLGL